MDSARLILWIDTSENQFVLGKGPEEPISLVLSEWQLVADEGTRRSYKIGLEVNGATTRFKHITIEQVSVLLQQWYPHHHTEPEQQDLDLHW